VYPQVLCSVSIIFPLSRPPRPKCWWKRLGVVLLVRCSKNLPADVPLVDLKASYSLGMKQSGTSALLPLLTVTIVLHWNWTAFLSLFWSCVWEKVTFPICPQAPRMTSPLSLRRCYQYPLPRCPSLAEKSQRRGNFSGGPRDFLTFCLVSFLRWGCLVGRGPLCRSWVSASLVSS